MNSEKRNVKSEESKVMGDEWKVILPSVLRPLTSDPDLPLLSRFPEQKSFVAYAWLNNERVFSAVSAAL